MNRRAFGFEITLAQVGPVHDPAFRAAPDSVKERVKGWIVSVGLEEKDADLAAGLDASGQALAPLEPETREHRVSAEGAADPSAPPLMPAREHSRTRYLLQGEVTETGAQFWWGYDPASHTDWGQVLDYHRRGIGRKHRVVRDVIGISEAALGRVRRRVMDLWAQYRREETRTPDSPRRDSLRAGGRADSSRSGVGERDGWAAGGRPVAADDAADGDLTTQAGCRVIRREPNRS